MSASEEAALIEAVRRFRVAETEKNIATSHFNAAKARLDAAAAALSEAEAAMGAAARKLARSPTFN